MPRIVAKQDNLNELNQNYEQKPLKHPVFLNSVPKCGTHLIRNIFRMFVPVSQQYHQTFIQIPVLNQHLAAFSTQNPYLSWGHLLFSDDSATATHQVKQLIIVRDPYSWVLARARFFLSDTFQGNLEHLKSGKISVEQVLNMMIFGIYQKAPTLQEIYTHNAVSWLGTHTELVKFEDIIQHLKNLDSPQAKDYFQGLFDACEMGELPPDWKERIKVGSDRKQSGTARENLSGKKFDIPNELPETQKQMVEFAAPGLRKILGYE
ncbi:hypothetical protein [Aliikangiella coralliicola]|uniref:Sulfotransferase domain-containing protein n=1 Tax=Aliikangiella coralliicola TaxID=2592383 RepID=A0A545U7N1_9GAMM|nr:hypothetical protein [Aliikangiella coralliicola]TQV85471.1 hypothetical protein FLL46_20110 [Aliikangiella coralliicola]